MSSKPRIYSDANPIIELARFAKDKHEHGRESDLVVMQRLLQAAANDDIQLFTSTISVAECVAVDDDYGKDVQEFFVGVLTSGRMFRLVQDSIFVPERARDLRWKDHVVLKGADAIHVASALEAGCTEFLTWDTDMNKPKISSKAAILKQLGIEFIRPSQTKLLPEFYVQPEQSAFNLGLLQ